MKHSLSNQSDSRDSRDSRDTSWGARFLPWSSFAILGLFSFFYFLYYLPQGFNLLDDAYLISLGMRLSDGESFYRDIAYFRTPLSPVLHMWTRELFGGSHIVLMSRIVWACELTLTVGVTGYICRKWFHPLELALVLCATVVYSSLLFAFPWYSYDGMFFTAVYALCFVRGKYLWAGLLAGLAALCKQSFLALLPVTLVVVVVAGLLTKSKLILSGKDVLRLFAGFAAVCVLTVAYYYWQGLLTGLWFYAFVAPSVVGGRDLSFWLFQNIPTAFVDTWYMLLPLGVAFTVFRNKWFGVALVSAVFTVWFDELSTSKSLLPFLVTLLSYVVVVYGLTRAGIGFVKGDIDSTKFRSIVLVVSVTVAALYTSGLNYSGLIFAYIGGAVALPVALALVGESRSQYSVGVRLIGAFGILVMSLIVHHRSPYFEASRSELTVGFKTDALLGLRSSAERVSAIDELCAKVVSRTSADDRVFAFPNPSCMNILVDRPAYGPVQWYYYREYTAALADTVAAMILRDPPELVVLLNARENLVPDKGLSIPQAIDEMFEIVDRSGEYYLLELRSSGNSESIEGGFE